MTFNKQPAGTGPATAERNTLRSGLRTRRRRAGKRVVGVWVPAVAFLLAGGTWAPAVAEDNPSRLSLERIYGRNEFEAEQVSVAWNEDGTSYVALEPSADHPGAKDVVAYDPATGRREVVVPASSLLPPKGDKPLVIEGFQWSRDRRRLLVFTNTERVWRYHTRGDYWVFDAASGSLKRLGAGGEPSTLMFAKFSPDGERVAYVRENNLYVEDLADGRITPLTRSGSKELVNGTTDWVYEEEFGVRDGFRWSPDGKRIAFWQIDTSGVREFALVNNTAGRYPRITRYKYPKVGERNPAARIGVIDVDRNDAEPRWIAVDGDPRDNYIARMSWTNRSDELILIQLNRLQNTLRVLLADLDDSSVRTVLEERDEAWVDVHDEYRFLADGRRFTWISERDGWRHLYLASLDGDPLRLVTPGEYDVVEFLHADERDEWFYFVASPGNPAARFLYRVRFSGGKPERVTPADRTGTHQYDISPDGKWALATSSSLGDPPRVELVSLPHHAVQRTLVSNDALRGKLALLEGTVPEFFEIAIGDGVRLQGWCQLPPALDPARHYPLLVHVYGEPAGQTVLDRWGGNRYLWHRLMAQQGYIVISVDNRGTPAPRGRAWRKSIYRQIGILAAADQAAAVRQFVRERSYVDADRIGVWGWSGGGSMSLNAIFKYPDLYKTAVSIAPVPDQRYYDTIYQERYMGLPEDNREGFREGSPITHAHRLEGNLLIIHGTGDDNCHYQTTELLIDELVRHNKRFTMMAYPNRTHAIREGDNTTRHLWELVTWYFSDHLPPGLKME